MKNLLLITAVPPFPRNSGGATRVLNTIKWLSKHFKITLITFSEKLLNQNGEDIKFYKQYCHQYYLYDYSTDLTSSIPSWFNKYYNKKLNLDIKSIIKKDNIDIVQIEFTQIMYLVKYIPNNIKTIFVSHDISSISFFRRIPTLPSIKNKVGYLIRLFKVLLYELFYYPKYNILVTVSEKDKTTLKKIFPSKKVICIPNGIERISVCNKKTNSKVIRLGYIGSYSHTPNRLAIEYFINKIEPILNKFDLNFKLIIAGNSNHTNAKFIKSIGYVDNLSDFYTKIDVLIAPIQVGSGSRIKILESLSFGVPVISTKIGAEGIKLKSNFLKITSSDEEFAQEIIGFKQPTDFLNLKQVLQPYLWDNIFSKCYQKVL